MRALNLMTVPLVHDAFEPIEAMGYKSNNHFSMDFNMLKVRH